MSHTVLVCDDAIFMRTMISDILAQAGFEKGVGERLAPQSRVAHADFGERRVEVQQADEAEGVRLRLEPDRCRLTFD